MSSITKSTRRTSSTTDLALIAAFAALIAVCAQISFEGLADVPFTLQMFAIFLAGAVLGAKRGFLAVVLYLAVGTAGVPVFAQWSGGPSVWTGASAGYLIAFPIAAFLLGLVATRVSRASSNPAIFVGVVAAAAAILTIAVVGTIGTVGMAIKFDIDLKAAWAYATPFFVVDIIKGVFAAIVAAAVLRAFPQLVAKR
ncbi:biotin transporter BioY [soil metagenome]